ncbi:PC-esterase domain-containing protein 1A [Holothuria leucospilota]|uniref:PC-esterase domain-containing protein 1A n=1 Tax=Holothuria leucospilota TaxID=206669 RepID=A0A9Q1BHZ1_HOLLE|nr:PC-esterase domain-containing protein 1A [Holothuria leucospilota]
MQEFPADNYFYAGLGNLSAYLCKFVSSKQGEESFMNDKLIEGGTKGVMNNGINYREVREYKTDTHLVRFYFVTRVHNNYWRDVIFRDISNDPQPDVIIMNSCLWDISRYGQFGMPEYKENLEKTFQTLSEVIPSECVCIWNTALPVANKIRGGFLLPELATLSDTLRLDVLEGNYYARQLAVKFDIQVLDLNYFFRSLTAMQVGDGVHWNFKAHRRFTNTVLSYLAMIWNIKLPYRQGIVQNLLSQSQTTGNAQVKQKSSGNSSKPLNTAGPSRSKTTNASGTGGRTQAKAPQSTSAHSNKLYSYNISQQTPAQTFSPAINNPYSLLPNYNTYTGQSQHLPLDNSYQYRRQNPSWGVTSQPAYHPHYPIYQQPWSQNFPAQQYNPYQWYPDSNVRRQQRMLEERRREIMGAMMNAALNNQFRVQ